MSARGLDPAVENLNFQNVADAQAKLLVQLESMAGLDNKENPPDGDKNWELVMKSGMALVGSQCNEYLTALFHFDRDNKAIRSGLTSSGTVTTTLMGLAGTGANPIAAMAAVFGLGTTVFDASVNTVVFQIGPAAVRNIVVNSQDAYRDAVMANITLYHSRPDVIIGLQGYLQLCTPVAIESAVEAGASAITFDLKPGATITDSQPPVRLGLQGIPLGASPLLSGTVLPSTEPALNTDIPYGPIDAEVMKRRRRLMLYVRQIAATMKPTDSVAGSDLGKIAAALGVPASVNAAEQRDKILKYILISVSSPDKAKAAGQMQDISNKLAAAGIHEAF